MFAGRMSSMKNDCLPLFCLAFVLLSSCVEGWIWLDGTPDQRPDMLIGARCQARCFTDSLDVRGENVKLSESERKMPNGTVQRIKTATSYGMICSENRQCNSCISPCDLPFNDYQQCSTMSCKKVPQKEQCLQSCSFLKNITTYKPGYCPAPDDVFGFAAACVKICDIDGDCDSSRKCCDNGCGRTCQDPVGALDDLPHIPFNVQAMERRSGTSIVLSWDVKSDLNESEPIIFVIEGRWNIGMHHSVHRSTRWEELGKTTMRLQKVLKNVLPGHWYEFRVAAVTKSGTRGYSEPCKPVALSKDPNPPEAPNNLTLGNTTVSGDKISQIIWWSEPYSDLPIVRYKIYWSKRLGSVTPKLLSLTEYKKAVAADKLSHVITLDPNTHYFIQLQAFSQYGDSRLRGERASVDITTPSINSDQSPLSGTLLFSHPGIPPVENITIEVPYFENGLMRAQIAWDYNRDASDRTIKFLLTWAPGVCLGRVANGENAINRPLQGTTHDSYFLIYDLRYNCRYTVTIQASTRSHAASVVRERQFHTPSCFDVIVVGNIKPDCPTAPPGVPSAPDNVTHSIIIRDNAISAEISWDSPTHTDRPVVLYRVMYGKKPSFLDSLLEVVPRKGDMKVVLRDLQETSNYIVKVQAVSDVGQGHVAHLEFMTPELEKLHYYKTTVKPPSSTSKSYRRSGAKRRQGNNRSVNKSKTNGNLHTPTKSSDNLHVVNTDNSSQNSGSLCSNNCSIIFTFVLLLSFKFIYFLCR